MRALHALLPIFALAACVSDATTTDAGKQTGEEGGPCFMDLTCKTGLVCVLPNVCAKPDGGTPVDASSSDAPADSTIDTGNPDAGPCPTTGLIAWWKAENSTLDEAMNFPLTSMFGMNMDYTLGHDNVGQGFHFMSTNWFESSPSTNGLFQTLNGSRSRDGSNPRTSRRITSSSRAAPKGEGRSALA